MPKDNQVTLIRLSSDAYAELEKQVQPLHVNGTTTELQAAYIIGQQDVLKKVRDGFTVSS